MIHLLLGPKYAAILEILVPMTVVQAVRVAKTGGSTVALSKERSGNAAAANLFRVLSLPISWYAVTHTGTVMTVIFIAITAEALGYLLSLKLAARRTGLLLGPLLLPSALTAMACVAALVDAWVHPPQTSFSAHLDWSRWAVVAVCLAALASMSALRGYLWRRFFR